MQLVEDSRASFLRNMSTPASQRTKVKRAAERASYEKDHMYSILDEGLVAHVGLLQDGSPLVIPMGYARKGSQLLLHGSISSRLMKVNMMTAEQFLTFATETTCGILAGNEIWSRNLRDRNRAGRPSVGKISFPPLNELPLSSGARSP